MKVHSRPVSFCLLFVAVYSLQSPLLAQTSSVQKIEQLETRVSELERKLEQALGVIDQLTQADTTIKTPAHTQDPAQSAVVADAQPSATELKQVEPLPEWLPTMAKAVTPYLSARVRVVDTDENTVLQNSASRGGFKLRHQLNHGIAAIGQLEWQINLTDNATVFAPDDNTNSDITQVAGADAFATRLGYIGLDFGDYGRLTFGKQWGAFADVANFTDQFPVFGGAASGIYATGTDGGAFGTGRAERAIQYKLNRSNFTFTAQTQLQGDSSQESDTFGVAFRYRPTDWFEIGAALNQADLDADLIGDVIRVNDDPRSAVIAARINTDRWYFGIGISDHEQTEIGRIDGDAELVDSEGIEAVLRYKLKENLRLYAGYNERDVDQNQIFDSNINIEDYLIGADYYFTPKSRFYILNRFREELGGDQLAIGYNLDF